MKTQSPKRPRGRQPIGAILVDGKWVMTEAAAQLAIDRVVKVRAAALERRRKTHEMLMEARPDLFVKIKQAKPLPPGQTTLISETPVRSIKDKDDLKLYQKTDATDYDSFWRSVQRSEDGSSNFPREPAHL